MKRALKVIHVELLHPTTDEHQHYYFGSQSAIYDSFTKDRIGITKESLWRALKKSNGEYKNKKAIIRQGTLITKQKQEL